MSKARGHNKVRGTRFKENVWSKFFFCTVGGGGDVYDMYLRDFEMGAWICKEFRDMDHISNNSYQRLLMHYWKHPFRRYQNSLATLCPILQECCGWSSVHLTNCPLFLLLHLSPLTTTLFICSHNSAIYLRFMFPKLLEFNEEESKHIVHNSCLVCLFLFVVEKQFNLMKQITFSHFACL